MRQLRNGYDLAYLGKTRNDSFSCCTVFAMEMRCANCIANVEADLDVATFLHVGQKVFVSPNDEIYDKIAKV